MTAFAVGQAVGKIIKYTAVIVVGSALINACSGKKEEAKAPATTAEIKSIVEPAVNQWTKDGWKIDSKTTSSFEGCQEIARGAGTVMKMTPQGTAVERTPSSDIFQVKGKMNNNTEEMVVQCSRGPNATMMIIGRR